MSFAWSQTSVVITRLGPSYGTVHRKQRKKLITLIIGYTCISTLTIIGYTQTCTTFTHSKHEHTIFLGSRIYELLPSSGALGISLKHEKKDKTIKHASLILINWHLSVLVVVESWGAGPGGGIWSPSNVPCWWDPCSCASVEGCPRERST